MGRSALLSFSLTLVAACASAGRAPSGTLVWPPGDYYLEATISYRSGSGNQRSLYSADLYIGADQSMRLDSHEGVCRDSTLVELQRDSERRIRSFHCGDQTFQLRPGGDTVTGDLIATVQEGYTITECVRYGANGACEQTASRVGTRSARKTGRLRVREQR